MVSSSKHHIGDGANALGHPRICIPTDPANAQAVSHTVEPEQTGTVIRRTGVLGAQQNYAAVGADFIVVGEDT